MPDVCTGICDIVMRDLDLFELTFVVEFICNEIRYNGGLAFFERAGRPVDILFCGELGMEDDKYILPVGDEFFEVQALVDFFT